MTDRVTLPPSAADARPSPKFGHSEARSPDAAYLRNPIAGREMLTPIEAVRAISLLSTMLEADERYRAELEARRVPE